MLANPSLKSLWSRRVIARFNMPTVVLWDFVEHVQIVFNLQAFLRMSNNSLTRLLSYLSYRQYLRYSIEISSIDFKLKSLEKLIIRSTGTIRKNMIHFVPVNVLLPIIKQCQFHKGSNMQAAKVLNIKNVKILKSVPLVVTLRNKFMPIIIENNPSLLDVSNFIIYW